MLSCQTALCNPDSGNIQQYTEVAGEAKAARMGDTLPIAQDQVRNGAELFEGLQDHRYFAKRQQTGPIGEGDRAFGHRLIQNLQTRIFQNNNGGPGFGTVINKTDIHTSDTVDPAKPILIDNLVTQAFLQGDRLLKSQCPIMLLRYDPHAAIPRGENYCLLLSALLQSVFLAICQGYFF